MALFLVAGLVFSYGLGHPPPPRVCTAHSLGVPAALVGSAEPQAATGTGTAGTAQAGHTEHAAHAQPAERTQPAEYIRHAAPAVHADAFADVPRIAVAAVFAEFSQPMPPPPAEPEDTCLSLAVLLAIVVIGLAARYGRIMGRRPRRSARILAPPPLPAPYARSLSCLQVLRL